MDPEMQLDMPFEGAEEYEHTEDKASLSEWRDATESVAAFATAHGGVVRFGYTPDGERCGVKIGKGTLENLANQIKSSTKPPQFPSITQDSADPDKPVILVRIEESPVKPVWAFDRPFKRVGRTTQRLSPEETHRLMNKTAGRTWDALVCDSLHLEDLDRRVIEDFLKRAEVDLQSPTLSVLENLGLIDGADLTRAAALLFARNPQRYIPTAQVKCARFEGDSSAHFADERTLDGDVLTQIDDALAFVQRNIGQRIRIAEKAGREVIPEYPTPAIREAIVNAVCHRDYTVPGTVQIRIYGSRLEIWNPGTLPAGLTIEALYSEHPSRPRNQRLAQALHRAGVIEHWGSGTIRIVEACEEAGLPRPEFVSDMNTFVVRFEKSAAAFSVSAQFNFNERQEVILLLLRPSARMTSAEYSRLFNVTERTAQRDLRELEGLGLVRRVGRGKATHFVASDKEDGG